MKFLCLECNKPMKLYEAAPPDEGSLDVKFECPECLHQIAMLTNQFETQIVSSLGVKIGTEGAAGDADTVPTEPGCSLAQQIAVAPEREAAKEEPSTPPGEIPWSAGALSRLERIPSFVRPMAISGIEQFARDNGYEQVDEAVLDQAKQSFGM